MYSRWEHMLYCICGMEPLSKYTFRKERDWTEQEASPIPVLVPITSPLRTDNLSRASSLPSPYVHWLQVDGSQWVGVSGMTSPVIPVKSGVCWVVNSLLGCLFDSPVVLEIFVYLCLQYQSSVLFRCWWHRCLCVLLMTLLILVSSHWWVLERPFNSL